MMTHSVPDRLIDASLAVATAKGWRSLTMADVAREAGLSLADVRKHVRSKADLMTALLTRVDQQALEGTTADDSEPVRDRLFDVLMRRFDVLQAHKAAVTALLRDLPRDPLLALPLLPQFASSMLWMLEAAGLSTTGIVGGLRAHGLALIYLNTLRVWISDDSPDLARTMAALDRTLTRVDGAIRRLPFLALPDAAAPAPSGDATDAGQPT